jgi:hypothetical protein
MNDVLEAYNLSFGKAANDREGGATRMYSAFQSGELVICAECRTTIEAVKTRLRDPKRENDVLKVLRDPRDDYYDSARYGYYSYETMNDHVPIPAEILRRERFERLRSQDPDMAATGFVLDCINQMRREAELEGEEAYCSPSVRMRHQIAKARRRWRW